MYIYAYIHIYKNIYIHVYTYIYIHTNIYIRISTCIYIGNPVRRYPRKYTAYDMEADIVAVMKGEPLPAESPAFLKVIYIHMYFIHKYNYVYESYLSAYALYITYTHLYLYYSYVDFFYLCLVLFFFIKSCSAHYLILYLILLLISPLNLCIDNGSYFYFIVIFGKHHHYARLGEGQREGLLNPNIHPLL
jgi:hypothetical protein